MKRLLLFILLCSQYSLIAQQSTGDRKSIFQYTFSYHKASILIHNEDLRVVDNTYPNGLQLDLAWQLKSKDGWDMCHCFPKTGLSLVFWDYDEPSILGYGLSAIYFIEPEYGANSRVSFGIRAGFGLSYMSNPYNLESNPDNQAYSTTINFALVLAAKSGIKINDKSKIDLGLYFNHNSNGGVASPNRGLNYPSIALGYSRYIRNPDFQSFGKEEWNRSEVMKRLDISPFVSWKKMADNVHVFSPGIEVKAVKQIAKINALSIGLEYLHDNFQQYDLEQSGMDSDNQKVSTAIGHEFLLGNLIFSQQFGVYLYRGYKEGADVYQRYGLNYNFTPWLAFGVNLKAHANVAQLVDFRLAFSIR